MATNNVLNNSSAPFTVSTGDMTVTSGNMILTAATTSTVGQIKQAGNRIFHTYGTGNTFVGDSAGNFTLTTANSVQNVGVGAGSVLGALGTDTGANVAVGYAAMHTLSSGLGSNVAVGWNSAPLITSGAFNVLIGVDAGLSYTSSESSNILIGYLNAGVLAESNVMRLGQGSGTAAGKIANAYIAGTNMNISTDAVAGTITIGNVTGATAVVINAGTGASSFQPTGTGSIAIGSTNTGATTLGNLTGTTTINFGGGSALSAYQTGSWTPVVDFGGATTGITYSVQTGNYTKIGTIVFLNCRITLSSKGSATGTVHVTGHGYTASVQTVMTCELGTTSYTGIPYIVPVGTNLFIQTSTLGTTANLDNTVFTNTSAINFSGILQL